MSVFNKNRNEENSMSLKNTKKQGKISEEIPMVENDFIVDVQYINTENLVSNSKYQRDIDRKKVEFIVSNFNPHKIGVIKVSYRDGKYHVYDGQHRLFAIKAINKGGNCIVPCEVHYNLTYADEARLFAQQYDGATKVDIVYQTRALFEAGDETIVKIKELLESVGLELSFSKSKQDRKIIAISKLRKIYNDLNKEEFSKLFTLIKGAWKGTSTSLDTEILGGMWLFYKTYKNEISEKIFIKNLSKVEPILIKRIGRADFSAKGDLKFAKVIWDKYNTNQAKNRLDYKFKG